MITFSPNGLTMRITNDQLHSIVQIAKGSGDGGVSPDAPVEPDLEVCETENHGAVEVYVGNPYEVGDSYHRWYIDVDGEFVGGAEYATVRYSNTMGDFEWEW